MTVPAPRRSSGLAPTPRRRAGSCPAPGAEQRRAEEQGACVSRARSRSSRRRRAASGGPPPTSSAGKADASPPSTPTASGWTRPSPRSGPPAARPIPTTPMRSTRAQVDNVVADAAKRFGRIDILVNAVGGSTIIAKPGATTEELTLADWQALIHFNLTGTFLFTHAVIPVMKRQKSGKIVNLASIAGRGKSVASSSAYATAKGGIIALTTQARQRARALRHQRQRHRARHHAHRAHPPALGAAPARGRARPTSSARRCGAWARRWTRPTSSASWPPRTPISSPASPST